MKTGLFTLAIALSTAAGMAPAQHAGLRASVVKKDITPAESKWLAGYPARQSTGVHDRLFHRVVALDDGRTQFFLASSDLCAFAPSMYDEFAARLQRETGIGPLQVWWTVTHTHSAPEAGPHGLPRLMMPERFKHEPDFEYARFLQTSLIEAIDEARARLEAARLASGVGFSMANINRRARDPEGRISLGMNPDRPADRQIGLIRLERPDGSAIALIANYAMHGTALGAKNTLISGDAPGAVTAYVEEKLGAPALFINGAAGDMAPIYSVQDDFRAAHITEFNVLLGDRILAANKTMAAAPGPARLRLSERIVETPRRSGFGWTPELDSYLKAASGETGMIRIPVRFLILDEDLALWAAPVELFSEIAMNVRTRSPYGKTFFFGYANGWLGYLATAEAFREGGYEPRTSPFTERVEDDFTDAVVAYLQGRGR